MDGLASVASDSVQAPSHLRSGHVHVRRFSRRTAPPLSPGAPLSGDVKVCAQLRTTTLTLIKTYINGTLLNTYSGSGSIGDVLNTQNDFRIGGRQTTSQYFQGRIDEVR